MAPPPPSLPPVRTNPPVANRVQFTTPEVTATWTVPAKSYSRGLTPRSTFKGTLLLLRKENLEIDAAMRFVPWQAINPTRAVVDSGAGPSVVRMDLLPKGWEEYAIPGPRRTRVSDASGQLLKVRAEVVLTIYVGEYPMTHEFLVVRGLSVPLILGWDFQKAYVETISPKTETIVWDNGSSTRARRSWVGTPLPSPRVHAHPRPTPEAVRLFRGITLPPRAATLVKVRCDVGGTQLVQERTGAMAHRRVYLQNAILSFTPGEPRGIYLTNLGDTAVNFPKGFTVGLASPHNGPTLSVGQFDEEGELLLVGTQQPPGAPTGGKETKADGQEGCETTGAGDPNRVAKPKPGVAWEAVPEGLRGKIETLLSDYEGLWAGQLGKVEVTPHRIQLTPEARPRRAQPYRASGPSREIIAAEVARQRKMGVIEPSSAEWAFPVVLVPKSDGSTRFCVDYRQLNAVTVRDSYPLPRMDDCIDFLGDATVFSTLDCNSGYWQIPVADEDKDKTTFVCHEGAYRYIRLPFGLSNAPATFQRAIDMILGGLKWKSCLVYLDDIIVFSRSAEDHVGHLREVFEALQGAGLSLKAKKCHFFQEEVEYLGHVVGRGHLKVQDKNIRGLEEASPPRCKKDLRSFLGMCNVYRRFVKDYARIARPLAAKTSTRLPDRWDHLTEEEAQSFEELKRRLISAPILSLPRREGEYTLDTDASAEQIGAVLLQSQPDGTPRPVGYWSRSLTPAERNYSTTERECLAVVWSVLLLRPYLEGTRFTVRTDHAALKWMLHMDSSHGRLARWRLRLAEYDYVVQTRPGAAHHAADTMSRLPTTGGEDGEVQDDIPCLTLPNSGVAWQLPPSPERCILSPLTVEELLEGQAEDPRCQEIRAEMDGNDKSRFREDTNGLLVRIAPLDDAVQVYVPSHMRHGVLMREHLPPQAGHPGANKMYTSMRRWFYWEAMVIEVYAFVANCLLCARRRVGPRRRTNYMKSFPATEPLTDLSIDLLGPLPRTKVGNEFLLVIVDRFSKLTRAIPLGDTGAESVTAAFLDYWVAAYGPPGTILSDNGPQFRSKFFQGVCSFLGVKNLYTTTYHPQTNGQVERYNRTILGQLRTYVEDHQDQWDNVVSMLTLAYNSRPQQSTGVAPLEFVAVDRVRNLSVQRLVGSPMPSEPADHEATREDIRGALRNLIHKVRRSLEVTQRRYKRNYDAAVRRVNKDIRGGDWVFIDGHFKVKQKLGTHAKGPYEVLSRDEHTVTLDVEGYPDRVSCDHVVAAPTPGGDLQELLRVRGNPQEVVVPDGHEATGKEFIWECFVGHEYDAEGRLRLWTRWWGYHPDEDTLELPSKFDRRKVDEYKRREGLPIEDGRHGGSHRA